VKVKIVFAHVFIKSLLLIDRFHKRLLQ